MKITNGLFCCFIVCVNATAYAEVVTDGTMGAVQNLAGQMQIPQDLGKMAGNNLFHSFQTFNIQTGESATFTGSNSIQNIISRVTGGQISNIDGLLKSEVGNANFYFINPAGVTFGTHANVDVPAAFHVSTANSLRFADGSQFNATDSSASNLSIAEPSDFGFLGNQTGDIKIQGSHLKFNSQKILSLTSSNDVMIDNGVLFNPSGAIAINAKGNISLMNSSSIDASTNSAGQGGDIAVTAATLTVDNSDIHSNALAGSQGNAGAITVLTKRLDIKGSGNRSDVNKGIYSRTYSTGDSGAITVTSDELSMKDNGGISASTHQQGNAGAVTIQVKEILLDSGGQCFFTAISSDTLNEGHAGAVKITGDSLTVVNNGFVSSNAWGVGDAGDVEINVSKVLVDGQGHGAWISSSTLNETLIQAGHAGTVKITGDSLTVLNGGEVRSNAWGAGDAGDVEINVNKILLDGQGFLAWITSDTLNETLIGAGHAGVVNITGDNLTALNGGGISSDTSGTGDAGNVTVNVNKILLDGQGFLAWIASDTLNETLIGAGHAGTVSVISDTLTLNGGVISSDSYGFGKGGDVAVQANTIDAYGMGIYDTVIYHGGISAVALDTSNSQSGSVSVMANESIYLHDGGEISVKNDGIANETQNIKAVTLTVVSPDIFLGKGSAITAQSTGNVDAGKINLSFSHALSMDSSFISTSANSGNGGNITINGGQLISLQNSGFLTSVIGANGNGGNINVTANSLIMNNGVIQANAVGGSGGDINLNLQALIPSYDQLIKGGAQVVWRPFQDGFNVIQAASQNGINGSINISSPQFSISGSMGDLNSSLAIPILDSNPCLSSAAFTSSLARIGKGGVSANEAKTVFVPAIAEHTNANLHSQTDSTKQKSLSSNKLIEQEKHPCMAISSDNNQLSPQNFFKE